MEHDVDMVRLLLSLGADPSIEDARFQSDARGWAVHFGHDDLVELLTASASGAGDGDGDGDDQG
jgi:hypothetical protein